MNFSGRDTQGSLPRAVALRQALDYTSTMRAVGVCLIGWVVYGIIFVVISIFLWGAGGGGVTPAVM